MKKIFKNFAFLTALLTVTLTVAEPPLQDTNEKFEEMMRYLTFQDLKKELNETGVITVRKRDGSVIKVVTRQELETGCLNSAEPWNIGCVPVQRNYSPKHSPLALEYEASVALRRAKDSGEKIEDEALWLETKKKEIFTQVDHQADEATGVGILDLSGNESQGKRNGTDIDIYNIFKRFDKYAEMVPGFFYGCKELQAENLIEKGIPVDPDLGTRIFYQASRIKMGLPKYKVHQTLRYIVTRHPKTHVITAAWSIDRRFNDPLGFKEFEFAVRGSPAFDVETGDFTENWKKTNMEYFPSEEYFSKWKENFIKDVIHVPANLEAWKNGKHIVHNNQFGSQNVHEQSGFFTIEPYGDPQNHKYFVMKHLYVRMDPTNPKFDFRDKDDDFDNLRTGTQDRFINHEASAIRKALDLLLKGQE
ncbi:MAG: hypothetical protein HYW47_07895 [Deltaproteobacteria bacterium]|nr:hypothetical protein [Deltaproteobacteria bacterium]